GSGSPALESIADSARTDGVVPRGAVAAATRSLHAAGGDPRLACAGAAGGEVWRRNACPSPRGGAIAACHARARQADQTDWKRIASLYDELATIMPSPIVELNRAVAYGVAFGADRGLEG